MPAGFRLAKFAELTNPRLIAVAADGTAYVTQREPGTLVMLRDADGDGVAEVQKVVAEKRQLHGVTIHNNRIYLATVKEVFALDTVLDLPSGFNRQALLAAMSGHVVAKGVLVGTFQRQP